MPRDVEEADELKYSGVKKGMRAAILKKAKKLITPKKRVNEDGGVAVARVRNMEAMESPAADMEMRENTPIMDKEMLEIRRGLEFELVARCDSSKIDTSQECWYLMDTQWLAEWTCFVEGKQDYMPPPISTWGLLADRVQRDEGKELIREGLEVKVDYRGVPPMVYFVLRELYGQDKSPTLCRFLLDIYAPAVPMIDRLRVQEKPMKEARIMVNKCRGAWTKWDVVDQDEDEEPCCCGIRKEHISAIIYWMVRCCGRGRAGRKGISYRKYKTVSNKDVDAEEGVHLLSRKGEEGGTDCEDDEEDHGRGLMGSMEVSDAERDYGKNQSYLRQWLWGQ